MSRHARLVAPLLLAACTSSNSAPDGPPGETDDVGARIAVALADVAAVHPDVLALGHELRQPVSAGPRTPVNLDSCQRVEDDLWQVCAGETGSCWAAATFYWAHDVPRCSARLELDDDWQDAQFGRVYLVDLAGASRANPSPECGDGELDDGEDCDDGNREAWDGCDPDCQAEPFEGCETVIQQEFSAAGIAWIDATRWQSPRSHLMTHAETEPFAAVDATLCDRARVTAEGVCARLAEDMPFVDYCVAETHLVDDGACAVRLRVQFLTPSPDDGVFTTALQGILAFELR